MKTQDLMGRMDTVIKELEGLRAKDELSADENSRADQLMSELNDLGPKIQQSIQADAAIDAHKARSDSRGAAATMLPVAGAEERAEQRAERKSLGQRLIETPEYRAMADNQRTGVATLAVDSLFEGRALVNTGTLPADYMEPMRIPGIMRPADPFGSLRDVLTVGQTNSDALIYFRETAFTNNAAEVGEATATTGTTGLKPESALTYEQVTDAVVTIAHWIPITKQTLWNAPEIRTYVEGRLIDGLKLREDAQLLNGNGVGENLTGLLNTSGIQILDGAAFTAAPVADTGTNNENFNRVLRGHTRVSTVGRAMSNFSVMNPADHEEFMTSTDAQKQYFGSGPFAAGNVPTLWGRRVVVNENMPAGRVLVGDGRMATIFDRMSAQVSVGTIDNQFVRNMITILAEERVGLAVFRPQAFAVVTLA